MEKIDIQRADNQLVMPEKINWQAATNFLFQIYTVTQKLGYESAIIDFSEVKHAYPNGMVPIISRIDSLRQQGVSFMFIEPKDLAVKTLFQHTGWLYYLDPVNRIPPQNTNTTSLPLMQFSNDIELNDIVSKSVEICLQQLVFAEGVPQSFEWALNEVAGNVLIHSNAQTGWIQVMTYKENHTLALVVSDSGIGIPEAMKVKHACNNDQEALELALQKGVTSNPEDGQGNGLAGTLAIAQANEGYFAITSGRGRVQVSSGKVEPKDFFPPYPGTFVEMQFDTNRQIDLPKALWGHKPIDYFEVKFEGEKSDLIFKLREYASSFGNRITGKRLRNLVNNLIKQNPGHSVEVIMDDVAIISSSFADELFGKLFVEMGPIDFSRLVKLKGVNPTCKSIIDLSVRQRLAQTIKDFTPID